MICLSSHLWGFAPRPISETSCFFVGNFFQEVSDKKILTKNLLSGQTKIDKPLLMMFTPTI